MSEAASVETLRAVNRISPQTLNAIMARHYPLRTAQYTYKPNDYSTCNVGRYLRATRQYGQRSIAIDEIMAAARRSTRGDDDDDDFVLSAKRSDPSDSPSEHQQRVSETYLDDLECNTTRNCLADVEILDEEPPEIIEYEPLSPVTGTEVAADETIRVPPEPTTGITDCRASTRSLSAGASILADEPVRVSSVILDD